MLLERSKRALSELDAAIADARRSVQGEDATLGLGYGPFSRPVATTIADELARSDSGRTVRLDEGVTPDLLQRVARHDLAAAVVMESPKPVRQHGVRIDTLRDQPLLVFRTDLGSCWPATEGVRLLVEAALRARDAGGWLTERRASSERPTD